MLPKPCNILIVDDHPVIRGSIESGLAPLGATLKFVLSARDMRRYLAEEDILPDLIILDIDLPDADGVKLVSEIHMQLQLPVLIFSCQSDWATIRAAERNGASGFVAKAAEMDTLASGVNVVLAGGQFFPQAYVASARRQVIHGMTALNDREFRVLDLLIEGHPNKYIADSR